MPDASPQPRPRLTRDRVLVGAVALADEIGIDDLTIRRLADALDTKPMTLYHHVPNKEAIIDGMVDLVYEEIGRPDPGTNWRIALETRAHRTRAVLRRHPWATPLMDSRTTPGPETLGHLDAVLGCLRTAGLDLEMTGHTLALVDAYTHGFALQEAALPATTGDGFDELVEPMLDPLPAGSHPWLVEFATQRATRPDYDFGDEFGFGLSLILDGLERAITDAGGPPQPGSPST